VKFDDFLGSALEAARSRADSPRGRRALNLLTWLFDGAGGGLQVVEAPGVGTARLRVSSRGAVIEVDPGFVEDRLDEPDSALHLLAHEILHRVRGDLSRFVHLDFTTRTLLGLALDMYVDAHLERLWFDGEGAPYLQRVYRASAFPELMLLPPAVLFREHGRLETSDLLAMNPVSGRFETTHGARTQLHEWLKDALNRMGVRRPSAVAELYLHAWLDSMGFAEFWPQFCDAMAEELPLVLGNVPLLLGDHELRDVQWKGDVRILSDVFGIHGGHGKFLRLQDIRIEDEQPDPAPLLAAIRMAMDADPDHPVTRKMLTAERGVVGRLGRSEALSLSLGYTPLFWTAPLEQEVEDDQRVQLYVDGSGSMDEQLPFLFKLCAALDEHVGDRVHVFSNQVSTALLKALADGRYETTGGTDFDCILDHALEQRYRRILVLTDGYGRLDEGLAGRARDARIEVYLVLFGLWFDRDSDLSHVARRVWEWTPGDESCAGDIPF